VSSRKQPDPVPEAGAETVPPGVTTEASASYLDGITENYSQYVAVSRITIDGVGAFNAGDPVNADHPLLKDWLKDGLVEKAKR
jgi:hypothetical protein